MNRAGIPLGLLLLVCLTSQAVLASVLEPPRYLAVVIGSKAYHGRESLKPLRYTDDDVLRFLRVIWPMVPQEHLKVLVDPDPEVARELARSGLSGWQPATTDSVRDALDDLARTLHDLKTNGPPGTELRVIFFVSAHGDVQGVHLDDGILSGRVLQNGIERLEADAILVVADACFSDVWFKLKGGTERHFPLDEVAQALGHLERVGAVTAQTSTREEETLVRDGLLTHVVVSALLGGADLDGDGRVTYAELDAYLHYYSSQHELFERFRVQTPKTAPERPAMALELADLGNNGMELTQDSAENERYWIVSRETGQLVAELCKRGKETRRLHLPPGRYHVVRAAPAGHWYGREGNVVVTDGFARVHGETLDDWWVWGPNKGPNNEKVPTGARPLTSAEASYHAMTPFRGAVPWPPKGEQWRLSLRLMGQVPVMGPGLSLESSDRVGSLTMEHPSANVGFVLDRRQWAIPGGFVLIGAELVAGASSGNVVEAESGLLVLSAGGGGRFGLERPLGRSTVTAGTVFGLRAAQPLSLLNPEAGSLSGYGAMTVGYGALESGLTILIGNRLRLELGARLEWTAEPYLVGPASVLRVKLFGAGVGFVGVVW